ncbi:hypothetical protein [Chromobacterium sp. ATCC 53434]|uniref:hypothetical protein n=1 Tax=Chromobacterium sp. (strain ATCC 53434 / SC 14030) TaxID=2059672 RepID=UPI00130518F5|nr:hypothetical protein [Chromobacterium sp. ATCC 53434]
MRVIPVAMLSLTLAQTAAAEAVSAARADVVVTRAVEAAAIDGLARVRPHKAFSAFLAGNGADGMMTAIRNRRDKATLTLAGVLFEAGCRKMAGDYFRYNYQFSSLGDAEAGSARARFDRLSGPGSAWCVELVGDEPAAARCKRPAALPQASQARLDKLARQAEIARAGRNAYLSTIRFNRYDYVAAVTSPALDLYDPAMQRPDNAACAILADNLSRSLFSRLRHDDGDDAYYAGHRRAITAARAVWLKMDELDK